MKYMLIVKNKKREEYDTSLFCSEVRYRCIYWN